MVGKLSADRLISGSRIPVLYLWRYGAGHPYSTPNQELEKSIAAKHGESRTSDIGEPGIVGNLLENTLALNACEVLGLPDPILSPDVVKLDNYQVSCDAISDVELPWTIHASELVSIIDPDETGEARYLSSATIDGPVPIEVKCTSDYPQDEPPDYRGPIQLQMQMAAIGADFGVVITLYRGIERRITVYQASRTIQDRIDALADEFLDRVAREDYYPPINVSDAAIAPAAEEKTETDITPLEEDIARLERLRADRDGFNAEIESIETRIMEAIGDAHVGTTPNFRVEWPVRRYKAQPEKISPAKPERVIRLKSLKIKGTI